MSETAYNLTTEEAIIFLKGLVGTDRAETPEEREKMWRELFMDVASFYGWPKPRFIND